MKIIITETEAALFESIEDTDPLKKVSVTRFARDYLGLARPRSGILPPAVRWLSDDGTKIIVERPPFRTHISPDVLFTAVTIPSVFIPWSVYAIEFDKSLNKVLHMGVYFKNSQIFTEEDTLFTLPGLSNASSDLLETFLDPAKFNRLFKACLREYHADPKRTPTVAHCVLSAVASFWQAYTTVFCSSKSVPLPGVGSKGVFYPRAHQAHVISDLKTLEERVPPFLMQRTEDNLSTKLDAAPFEIIIAALASSWSSIPLEEITSQEFTASSYDVKFYLDNFIAKVEEETPDSIESMFRSVFGVVTPNG